MEKDSTRTEFFTTIKILFDVVCCDFLDIFFCLLPFPFHFRFFKISSKNHFTPLF